MIIAEIYFKKYLNKFLERKEAINLFLKITLGASTIFVATQANQIAIIQTENMLIETAPLFNITKTSIFEDQGIEEAYLLTNKKGVASYLQFNKTDIYEFTYLDYSFRYRVNIGNNINITKNIIKENEWYYIPEIQGIDTGQIKQLIQDYIKEKTGKEIYVAANEVYKVNFVDYKNKEFDFYFHYSEILGLQLAHTDNKSYLESLPEVTHDRSFTTVHSLHNKEVDFDFEEHIKNTVDDFLLLHKQATVNY